MKLVLNSICEGTYNKNQLHAFIQIKDAEDLTALEPFEYRAYLNEKVLPVLKAHFKSQNHTMDEFVFDDQGAPLSLLIRSNTSSNNTAVLFKSLDVCIKSSNQFFNPKKGFFAVSLPKEESSEEDAGFSATFS